MRYFSMFSGIGGFEYGIESAFSGYQKQKWNCDSGNKERRHKQRTTFQYNEVACIGYSEINQNAIAIYRYHYPQHRNYGDATKIKTSELPDFEFLVGGFPCQSFSIAGKRGGFSDERGNLFFEIARICGDKRLGYILLENVKGLLSHESGKTFQTILGVLSEIGYILQWQILNSCDFGVPQSRERVFIIGCLGKERFRQIFPIGESGGVSAKKNETDWVSRGKGLAYCLDTNYNKGGGKRSRTVIAITTTGSQGQRVYDTDGCSISISTQGGGWGRQSGLYANNGGIRKLTPIECERLQGFPDNWTKYGLFDDGIKEISDNQRYNCLGNAVTTNVIRAIMDNFGTIKCKTKAEKVAEFERELSDRQLLFEGI